MFLCPAVLVLESVGRGKAGMAPAVSASVARSAAFWIKASPMKSSSSRFDQDREGAADGR